MTAREAYQMAYALSDKSMGMLFYFTKRNETEVLGNTEWLTFGKKFHEANIKAMEDIEKNNKGFMFWSLSPEGEAHIAKKGKKLGVVFSSITFMQK